MQSDRMNVAGSTRSRLALTRSAWLAAWMAANLVLGYLLCVPLAAATLLARYLGARLWDLGPAPFEDAEAPASVVAVVFIGGPLLLAVAVANIVLRRRPGPRELWTPAFWTLTTAVLLGPFMVYYLGEFTLSEMLGKGLLW